MLRILHGVVALQHEPSLAVEWFAVEKLAVNNFC